MGDTVRLDWLEGAMKQTQVWLDSSSGKPRYSVDGGDSWHDDLRSAIDGAILKEVWQVQRGDKT